MCACGWCWLGLGRADEVLADGHCAVSVLQAKGMVDMAGGSRGSAALGGAVCGSGGGVHGGPAGELAVPRRCGGRHASGCCWWRNGVE